MSDDTRTPSPSTGPGANNPPTSPTQNCTTCTVTLTPADVKICGAGTTSVVTAAGTPAGGTYAFSSSHASNASVAGNNDRGTITAVAQGRAVVTVTYTVAGCTPCTATANVKVCTCTQGRKYTWVLFAKADLIGAKAKIKTRYGKLCCEIEGCSTVAAFHAVYTNISNNSGALKWAQVGFSRRRNAGSAAIIQYRKAEIKGDNYFIDMDTAGAPAEGSTHEWKCELEKANGKWSYSDDGTVWKTYSDNFWKTHLGTDVQWTGEILNKEDDMPGTDGDKCSFTECQFRLDGGAFQNAAITAGDVKSDDSAEWGSAFVSATAFNIWDKIPNS